jgi:hypothetical protein
MFLILSACICVHLRFHILFAPIRPVAWASDDQKSPHPQRGMTLPDKPQAGLSQEDHEEAEELSVSRAPVIYEVVRQQGEAEPDRPLGSLFWSGMRPA